MKDIALYIVDAVHTSSNLARIKDRNGLDYQTKFKIILGNYFLLEGNIEKYYKNAMRVLKSEGGK